MTSSAEPIQVEATPIDTDLRTQDAIQRQLAEIAREAQDLAGRYTPHEIVDRDDCARSAKDRASANKDVEALELRVRKMTAAVDSWSRGVKEAGKQAIAPLKGLNTEYRERIDAFKGSVVDARYDMMRERYEEYAPALALPAEGAESALVPFDRLWAHHAKPEKWSNYGTNDVKAVKSMEAVVESIASGERSIDALVAEQDREAVKALYFSTLDMDRAMARAGELAEARAKVQAMEAERAAWREQADGLADSGEGGAADAAGDGPHPGDVPGAGPAVAAAAAAGPAQAPQPPVEVETTMTREQFEQTYEAIEGRPLPRPALEPSRAATWLFYCRCTPQQAAELEDRARVLGIGRVLCKDGGLSKYRLVPEGR